MAATGERSALAEVRLRHRKTLYPVAYSVLLDSETTDDGVRAVFREVQRFGAGVRRAAWERAGVVGREPHGAPVRGQAGRSVCTRGSRSPGRVNDRIAGPRALIEGGLFEAGGGA